MGDLKGAPAVHFNLPLLEATWIEGWNGVFHNRRVGSLEHALHGFFPIHSTPQTQTQAHLYTTFKTGMAAAGEPIPSE